MKFTQMSDVTLLIATYYGNSNTCEEDSHEGWGHKLPSNLAVHNALYKRAFPAYWLLT